MIARRLLATAVLLTGATLALTACDPDGSAEAGPTVAATATPGASAGATSGSSGTPSGTTGGGTTGAKPTGGSTPAKATPAKPSAKPSAKPTGKDAPAPDCTAAAQRPGHTVINAVSASGNRLSATATRFTCGPDVDNDGYYSAVGPATSYTFATGATAQLVTMADPASPNRTVPTATLAQHVNDCAADREVPQPYNCFGGVYDITVNPAGQITHIAELYHP